MQSKHTKILAVMLLLAWGCASAADVYKWVDENGRVHYGDQPGNASAREITLPATQPMDEAVRARGQKQKKLLQVFEEERQEKHEQEARAKAEQQKREQECALAKVRLKNYESAGEPAANNKNSKERTLAKLEYKQVLEDAKQAVEHWCR